MKKQSFFIGIVLSFTLAASLSPAGVSPPSAAGPGAQEKKKEPAMEQKAGPLVVDMAALPPLSRIIGQVEGKKVVYVGEYHDRFSNHDVELEILKGLFRKDPALAIGMEMFQRPFQSALDEYINGSIGEREFLKKTEYFSRWIFDYHLYKPILDFARAEKIPVVALNARRELSDKVARSGIASLSAEEKKEIPPQMDFSDEDYRNRVKQAFSEHKGAQEKNFDTFYEAQVLWDETMALSVDAYLRKNPGRHMVVLAGSGHLARGSGIPKRAFRRNGYEYAVILNDADVERGMADYLVFPKERDGETAPRLMVQLKEDKGDVVVTEIPSDSVSLKAGIRPGDVIRALDNAPVHTVEDVKIELFYKHHGERITVQVLRKRVFLSNRELEFDVTLP